MKYLFEINHNFQIKKFIINHNDGDTLGLVKWKLQQGIIQQNDIIRYELSNRLSNSNATKELTQINKLLPVVNLPVYNTNRTLLDQLILAERRLNVAGRFKRYTIKIRTSRQLSLLIIFAIKERLFSSDVINFSLEGEMTEAIKKYNPFFERIETAAYEKDASDLSAIKYVLNSKYWLQRELGNFARQSENYPIIAQAYQYIIQKVLSFAGRDEFKRRRLCRNYILFDVMNDIFLDEHKGNLPLIVHIYTQLQELLAWDYNFLHQKAKCFLNYCSSKTTR